MAAVLSGGYYANESGKRLLLWAVAGSVALHLGILLVLPALQNARRADDGPQSLRARLARQVLAEPVAPESQRPAPRAERSAPAAPAAKFHSHPAAARETELLVAPAARGEAQLPAPAPAPATAPAQRAAPVAAAANGPDPAAVARYRSLLMDLARRDRTYPRIALDNDWQGRSELRVAIGADGNIAALGVRYGAGHAVLDEAAQAMIRRAKARAPVPPALRGQAFTLEIAVDFLLRDEAR